MSGTRRAIKVGWVAVAAALLCTATEAGLRMPPKVAETIKREFPNARVTGVGRERENGVMYYEVNLSRDGRRVEVEVTADGAIGEIEAYPRMEDLPKDVRAIVAKATKGARHVRIERHERRGRARNGTFAPLPTPTVCYEVRYVLDGRRRKLWLDAKAINKLPEKAKAAVKKAYPKATITDVDLEFEDGALLYEVELTDAGAHMEVKVSAQGRIVETAMRIPTSKLPPAVLPTVREHAKGGRIKSVEKIVRRAVLKGGRITTLRKPLYLYEADVVKGGREADIEVGLDGKLLKPVRWKDDGDDDDDDDDN